MAKYSDEFKLKLVEDYLAGEGSYRTLATKYNIPSIRLLYEWVQSYRAFGINGIQRKRKHTEYTFEFKQNMVECYLITSITYRELANRNGITNSSILRTWVAGYLQEGIEAFMKQPSGRQNTMTNKKPKSTPCSPEKAQNDAQRIRELEEENLHLRIQNAYLKERRRLRHEETRATKKKRESSQSSENHSD